MQLHSPLRSWRRAAKHSSDLVDLESERQCYSSGRDSVCNLVAPGQLEGDRCPMLMTTVATFVQREGISPVCVPDQFRRPHSVVEGLKCRPRHYLGLGTPTHRPDKWIVDVQHGPAVDRQRLHELALGLGNRRLPSELPHMCLTDIEHNADAWWRDVA